MIKHFSEARKRQSVFSWSTWANAAIWDGLAANIGRRCEQRESERERERARARETEAVREKENVCERVRENTIKRGE